MTEAVILARRLTKRFGQVAAVRDLDVSVAGGEIFGLVGPDGAGKTTTIRMLTAIMLPTSGRATVLGHSVVDEPEAIKADIGYMAQRFNLYGDLTVAENLAFFADVFGVGPTERRERIQRLLGFARLTEFQDRRAHQLSGGMQKKLALAATLIHQPKVLFLDEPTTGVDPVSRREFWEILTNLHLRGITIFISTPYMDEAERCSRVGLLYSGQLIECDTPGHIRAGLDGELLEVRTTEVRSGREAARGLAGVLQVQTYGDRLHVFVDDAAARRDQIRAGLEQAGVTVQGIRTTQPRMEEAFISLVRAREAELAPAAEPDGRDPDGGGSAPAPAQGDRS
jgi:ABC-2 type transport system ATP-binding protein